MPAAMPLAGGAADAAVPAVTKRARRARRTELLLVIAGMVLVAAYAGAVEANLMDGVTPDFWVPAALLAVVFLVMHVVVRLRAPYADPVLLPAAATLNGLGVAFLRRIDLARTPADERFDLGIFAREGGRQLLWTTIAVACAAVLLYFLRDHRTISRYAWTLGFVGIVLMMIPAALPRSLSEVNGAKLWIRLGSFSIQPGEFAKLMLLSFFAYYLVRKREVLALASKRFLGIDFPRGRDLGPVVVVWMLSVMVLVFEKDLGTALLYFGMFVVMLYIATERVSWLIIGLLLFFSGAFLAYFLGASIGGPFANFYQRANIWLHPFEDPYNDGYQLVQSLLGLGTGGMFGTGPGAGSPNQVPEVRNDFIFAGMGEEIGLFGLTALLVLYLFIVQRGIRAGLAVRDSFGKLLAGGLSFTLGLQVFVIIGGVTKLIPLTGQTTPFLAAGGSSLMANWLLIALLIRISDAARAPLGAPGGVVRPPVASAPVRPRAAQPPPPPIPQEVAEAKTEMVRPPSAAAAPVKPLPPTPVHPVSALPPTPAQPVSALPAIPTGDEPAPARADDPIDPQEKP
ncbi:cell division protein FtsW (lipid II flippase) [Allocatelliglobosispora scoriae]|uniref:Cell division protein FtsW (Lipid II flippase) n=1 Tax=Allocatelliglobosispora scoriae TaxID=643052 RepID=A0A841BUD9_9ACTN|nr:cell division protein FtsW (lipid II flippase) [Allocatelliglobosispora scoriae]